MLWKWVRNGLWVGPAYVGEEDTYLQEVTLDIMSMLVQQRHMANTGDSNKSCSLQDIGYLQP